MMFFSAAEEWAAEFAETKGVKLAPAVPTVAEVGRLLEVAGRGRLLDYVIVRVLYAGGLRAGELAVLLWADVLWDEHCLFIREGKGGKDRYLLIDSGTLQVLRQLRGDQGPDEMVVGFTVRGIEKVFRKIADETGLYQHYQQQRKTLSPHSLRHAFATHCYENGMDIGVLSFLMGHEYASTTAIYIRWAEGQLEGEYEASSETEPVRLPYLEELKGEFVGQIDVEASGIRQLPAVATHQEVRDLLEQARSHPHDFALLMLLYYTGLKLEELLQLGPEQVDWQRHRLRLPRGEVLVKPAVLQMLHGAPFFTLSLPEAEERIAGYAQQTGLTQRFAALGRRFFSRSLRTAFAVHRIRDGMTEITLLNQLGHDSYHLTAYYVDSAVGRFEPDYRASHELVRHPQLFELPC